MVEQQLMLETIMNSPDDRAIDVAGLRVAVKEASSKVKAEEDYDKIEAELLAKFGAKPLEKKEAKPEEKPTEEPADKKEPAEAKK